MDRPSLREPASAPRRALRWLVQLLVATVVVLHCTAPSAEAPPKVAFLVIVNASNPTQAVSRSFLADAFLKKTTRWGDDSAIKPADQAVNAPVRSRFSEAVLRRSVGAVKSYWQQRIFSGRDVPPPELAGDDAVVAYVAQTAGAVGYVSGAAKLDGVRAIAVR